MTSSRRFGRLLQAGCLGFIGMLAAAGCGGSSSPKGDVGVTDGGPGGEVGPFYGTQLTVTPPSLDFGNFEVGIKTAPLTVTVTNAGTAASGPLNIVVSGTGVSAAPAATGGCTPGAALAPKASCTISVTIQVAAAGQVIGSIEVGDSAATTKKIPVSGIAVVPGEFSLTPTPLDLGPVFVGRPATGTVILTNNAKTALTGILINVSPGSGFTDSKTGTCTDVLAVGQTCTIIVGFTGTVSGPAKGTLTVNQGNVTRSVILNAQVQKPATLVITPISAALQTVVGTPSAPAVFYVSNAGDVTSAIPTVTITPAAGTGAKDFSFVSDCPAKALAGGATSSCQVSVTYNPASVPTANASATLTVAEPAGGSSVSAILTGSAVPPSTLVITGPTAAPVALGDVVVGNTGAAATFTVTNNGGENSGALEITAAPGQFVIVSNGCADKDLTPKGTPAATNSCTFTAAFKPAVGDAGTLNGQLKAKGANTLNPAFFNVSGNAIVAAKLAISPKSLEFAALPTGQKSEPKTLTVSNEGGAPTGALKVENTGAQFKIEGDTCNGLSLTAAGTTKTCTITVTFTPTGTDVEASGNIVVTDTTGPAGSVSASLHGTGMKVPAMLITPQNTCPEFGVDDSTCARGSANLFTNMVIGKSSDAVMFKVESYTDPSVAADSGTITFPPITGDAAADFTIVQNNCTAALPSLPLIASPRPSCSVTVAFKPATAGLRKAVLNLTTSRGATAQATLEAKGLPVVELQPLNLGTTDAPKTGLDFPGVALGKNLGKPAMLPYRVWVRDTSAADRTTTVTVALPTPSLPDFVWPTTAETLAITKTLVSPPVGANFLTAQNSNPCTPAILNLSSTDATQGSYTKSGAYWYCDFGVQFFPQSKKGPLSADLSASATGGGNSTISLRGTATGALVVNPKPALIANPVAVGMSDTIDLTIENQGTTDQKGLTFALTGTGSGDFQIVKTDCWGNDGQVTHHSYNTLPAVTLPKDTGKCIVTVGFAPQTEAKYSVTFTATAANGDGTADDETDSTTIVGNALSTYGGLELTPATASFGDVAEDSTTATPVTFTVKNTGTLKATAFTAAAVSSDVDNPDFKILPSTGVEGACNYENSSFILEGGKPCTIRVMPYPTSSAAQPSGAAKKAVSGLLKVSVKLAGETIKVEAPMTYNVMSSILVKEIDAPATSFATSMAYAFGAAGKQAKQTHKFEVKNIGSTAAMLSAVWTTPFSVIAGGDGLTPPACTYGTTAALAPNSSCTLVLQNDNTVKVKTTDLNYLTISDSGKSGSAKILLSSATFDPSNLIVDTLQHGAGALSISLGSVPFDSSSASFVGGKATVWFKNDGGFKTAPLTFRWDVSVDGTAEPKVTDENKADPEFLIDSDETSCTGKSLEPQKTCSMSIHFKPNFQKRGQVGLLRSASLNLIDSTNETVVTFTATPTATASLYIEDVLDSKVGFYRLPDPGVATDVEGAMRQFRITYAGTGDQKFVLPAKGTALCTGVPFVVASTQPTSGGCTLGTDGQTLGGTTPSCLVNIAFKPASSTPILQHAACSIAATSATAVLGLGGHAQQPVKLVFDPTSSDFGTIGADQTVARSFTLRNTGDVGMSLDASSLSMAVTGTFALKSGEDLCTGKRLAANETCTVTVEAKGGAYTDGSQVSGDLSAAGGGTSATPATLTVIWLNAAALTVSPPSEDFGSVAVTGSKTVDFEIANAANAMPTGAVKASLSGSDQFSIAATTCLASGLAAGGKCTVTVRFAPTALLTSGSDLTGTLSVTADPGVAGNTVKAAAAVGLKGKPIAALTILSSSTPVTTVALADTTAVTVLTVKLDASATATAPLKTNLAGSEFMLVNDGCYGQVLNQGDTCPISVKYIGTKSATKKTATLTVDGGSAAKKATVEVTATDVQAQSH